MRREAPKQRAATTPAANKNADLPSLFTISLLSEIVHAQGHKGAARVPSGEISMYGITSWEDVRRVAPTGAKYFRYRRPTGERRKFYEGGFAFPLEPEGIGDRKPANSDGVFAVHFYTAEEAQKEPNKGCPLIIQPPDCDELLVEFPKGWKPGDSMDALYLREQLDTIKDLARSAASPTDAAIKLLEKVSHERDLMAAEAEKNRIGPVWQLILEHHPQLKDLLIAAVPLLGAAATSLADRITSGSAVATAFAELRKEQQMALARVDRNMETLASVCKQLREDQKAFRKLLKPGPKTSARRKKVS